MLDVAQIHQLEVHAVRSEQLAARDAVRHMILGLLAFMGRPQGIEVVPITLVAVGTGAVVVGIALVGRSIPFPSGRYLGLLGVAALVGDLAVFHLAVRRFDRDRVVTRL